MALAMQSNSLAKPQCATCNLVPRAQTHSLSGPSTGVGQRVHLPSFRSSVLCRRAVTSSRRGVATVVCAAKPHKVALLGAAGGIGQPLALLLKMQPYVSELALYDIANVKGVAADLSHCNTPVKVTGYTGEDQLGAALMGADVVVIPAGVPRKPGMTRDDLFNINAGIVKTLAEACTKHSPLAVVAIISNPVNSTVPIAAEVFKAAGTYDKRRLIGVTTLDVVRANTFVAESKGLDVKDVDVPVVGGHAGTTILPLLSQVRDAIKIANAGMVGLPVSALPNQPSSCRSFAAVEDLVSARSELLMCTIAGKILIQASPKVDFSPEEEAAMIEKIQNAGTEVVEAKAGAGSATLSMAYAAARMTESILRGLEGEDGVYEAAYVESNVVPGLPYFASKVRLGQSGAEEVYGIRNLSAVEKKGVEELTPILKGNIEKGIEFAKAPPAPASK